MSSSLFHTLNISRQDMLSHLLDLDVTGNNLANFNTAGYKTSRSNFQEILQKQFKEGTQLRATQTLTMQGSLRASTNSLDWAIQGEGYFSVTLPDGTVGYTRDGGYVMHPRGWLMNEPDLSNRVLYAADHLGDNLALFDRFPDRQIWRFHSVED